MEKIRDKGEGSIFQRKDGTWISEYRIGKKSNGRPNVKSFSGKSKSEVKNKLKEFKYDMIKNDFNEVKKITVKEYINDWLYNIKINELKPKSFDRDEGIIKNQIYKYIADIQIGNLKINDIQQLMNTLIAQGYSYATIRKTYDILNSCFKLGIIKKEINGNPCVGVSLPKKLMVNYSKDVTFFNDNEIEVICKESVFKCKNGNMRYRLGHSIILLLFTGMRISELLGLKWENVNFDKKTIKISRSIVQVKNRSDNAKTNYKLLEQNSTKTDSSNRVIPLNQKALAALKEIQKINANSKYVMSNSYNKITYHQNIDDMFRKILKRCSIKPCGVHSLRHTFASMLFRKGVNVKTVSVLLGHSDVSITYNTYIHLIKEQEQEAVALLDEF